MPILEPMSPRGWWRGDGPRCIPHCSWRGRWGRSLSRRYQRSSTATWRRGMQLLMTWRNLIWAQVSNQNLSLLVHYWVRMKWRNTTNYCWSTKTFLHGHTKIYQVWIPSSLYTTSQSSRKHDQWSRLREVFNRSSSPKLKLRSMNWSRQVSFEKYNTLGGS